MAFVDFQAVKEAVSFADAISYLDLQLKKSGNQWRGSCPACGGGDRGLVLTEGRGFYCFADKKGGDVIALAAHILDVPSKEAAQHLAERAGIVVPSTVRSQSKVPVSQPESEEGKRGLTPLSYLEYAHEALIAQGFDPEWCERHGLGYAPRGVCRGSIAVPIRDEQGVLLGYLGVQDITYLPPDFQTNVVPFQKRA